MNRVRPLSFLLPLLLLATCASAPSTGSRGRGDGAALAEAVHGKQTETVRLLLEAGTSPDLPDQNGETPLIRAVHDGSTRIVDLLLQAGADPNATNQNGEAPLIRAVHDKKPRIVELLLDAGALPDSPNQNGEPALVRAVRDKQVEIVRLLLTHRADPNARDQNQRPVLVRAAKNHDIETVRLLVSFGAHPGEADSNGKTATSVAVKNDDQEILKILLEPMRRESLPWAKRSNPRVDRSTLRPTAAGPVEGSYARAGETDSFYSKRIAVVIGINQYQHWPALEGATSDARRVSETFRRLGFDEVIEVYEEEATRVRLLTLLGSELAQKTDSRSLAMIYFAGHGQTETLPSGQKRGYIIPVDGDLEQVYATAISMDRLRDLSNRLPALQVYYAMDSCYSGLGFVRGISLIGNGDGYLKKVSSLRSVQMITAGLDGEMAVEIGGQGLFTTYFLRALSGEADFDSDGYVTASEIGTYVRPQVSSASRNRQTPQFGTLEGQGEIVLPVLGEGR